MAIVTGGASGLGFATTVDLARSTPQGLDEMFVVNYLSSFALVTRLLDDGVLPGDARDGDAHRHRARAARVAARAARRGDAVFFQDPFEADEPVLYLACSPALEGRTALYLHRMTPREVDPRGAGSRVQAGQTDEASPCRGWPPVPRARRPGTCESTPWRPGRRPSSRGRAR